VVCGGGNGFGNGSQAMAAAVADATRVQGTVATTTA